MTGDNQKEILIRDSKPEDIQEIISLLQQLWPDRKLNHAGLEASFLKSFELSGHIIRVAYQNDRLIGLCSLIIRNNLKAEGNLANIDELVVDQKMRNRQIGKMLLDDAEKIAREHLCKFMGLESSFHREGAHRFYEQNGYQKQGYYISKTFGC
ncbi:GNAT family N-acetyltransferase [Daejeonella sp.]|uniref:GNAT family N-acetyltransferase n=1 Tax=Daejeonella sp. TaxID=2805397 RepID=UPI0030C4B011